MEASRRRKRSGLGLTIVALFGAIIGLALFGLGTQPAGAANEPVLSALSFTPATVNAGQTSTISFTATNAVSVEAVFFRLPDGTSGSLPIGSFSQVGASFSATVSVPANALGGSWRVSELGVKNSQNVTYRFLASDLHSVSTCPTFQNIGVFACASDIVRDSGLLTVQQSAPPSAPPALTSLIFSPATVAAGQMSTLSFTVSNAVAVEAVFFMQPDGSSGFLPTGSFIQTGNSFSATITVPANAAGGIWRVSELGVKNSQNVTYRFLASDLHSVSTCPTFQNIGVFACASDIVRDSGLLTVQQSAPPSAPPILSALSFTPGTVNAGQTNTISFTATNAVSVEAVFFKQPNGTSGALSVGPFTKSGDVFTATVSIPLNAADGIWRVAELGVKNSQSTTYRFLASDLFSISACPTFDNIGIFGCGSDIVRDGGLLTVLSAQQSPTATLSASPTFSATPTGPGSTSTPTPTMSQFPSTTTATSTAATTTPTVSPTPVHGTVPVSAGANLIAWPETESNVVTAIKVFSRKILVVYEYDAPTGTWRRFMPGLPAFVSNLSIMRTGSAYWVIAE